MSVAANLNILNTDALLSHGNTAGRRIVLDILEAGLRASDPYVEVQKIVRIVGNRLIVGREDDDSRPPLVFDLDRVGNIYVIGGGKAAQRQAKALEDILGDRIADGHVNAKKGDAIELKRIPVTLAGHPLPDAESVSGARKIIEVARKARKGDIVFFSESGGGSALMTLPCPGITLDELQELNRLLYFERGASMWDTNAVRNLLVMLRSREIRYCGEATYIQLSTDERPPKLKVNASKKGYGVLSAAESYAYAIDVLKRYECWDLVAPSIREFLLKADPKYAFLTPEERARMNYYRTIGPETMLEAARSRALELGLNAEIVASSLSDVEAAQAGTVMSFMAQEIEVHDRPVKAPCVLLCGGELLVTVGGGDGVGGRNQEFVLSTAPRIAGSERVVVASVDSDGTDGPTDQAGAIADGFTMGRAADLGIDVHDELHRHNTSPTLRQLGDTIYTGVRGTNIQDLRVVYVG